jgi:hypothetical protein
MSAGDRTASHRKACSSAQGGGSPRPASSSPDLDTSLLLEYATGFTVLSRITEAGRIVPPEKIERFDHASRAASPASRCTASSASANSTACR